MDNAIQRLNNQDQIRNPGGEINTLHVWESREQKMEVLTDAQEIYTVLSKLHVGVSQRYCARTLQTRPAFSELL